ncbi:MAG: hypothetical protein H7836_00965 [Magnetococcus sp. YQC-3]
MNIDLPVATGHTSPVGIFTASLSNVKLVFVNIQRKTGHFVDVCYYLFSIVIVFPGVVQGGQAC